METVKNIINGKNGCSIIHLKTEPMDYTDEIPLICSLHYCTKFSNNQEQIGFDLPCEY